MASSTTNYGLTKPDATELYDIGVQNENMDKIDTQMKQNADDITALVNGLYYHKGDVIKLYRTPKVGHVTASGLNIYISVPLSKPIASDVTSATLVGKVHIRGVGGYLGGSAVLDLSNTSIFSQKKIYGSFNNASQSENDICIVLVLPTMLSGTTNNTPVSVDFDSSSTLTLN